MKSGFYVQMCVLLMTLYATQGSEDLSSKLHRLERLFTEQIEGLKKDNRDLRAAVTVCQRESLKHPGDDHQRAKTSVHSRETRSDDGGPLEVVVDRLAQDFVQLSGKVQAMSGEMQTLSGTLQPLPGDVRALTGNVQALKNSDATRGSSFIHWGSSACSSSSQRVYGGTLAGSWYTHVGAAANPLCLTSSPRLQDLKPGESFTLLYGGEYETKQSVNQVPLCAMCWSPMSSTKMIPGTNQCPSGWAEQYTGFLMAGFYSHGGASEFICVDDKEEGLDGSGAGNNNGHLLYYTKTVCGSLPCPPYTNDKMVTCAVCSK